MTRFILGSFSGILLVILGMFYALSIRDHRPDRYRGIWHYLAANNTRRSAIALAIAIVIGSMLGVLVIYTLPIQIIQINLLIGFIVILAVSLAFVLYRLRRKDC